MFRVMIVEDEQPSLDLMKYVIGQNPHYTIVGAFTNPLEALDSFPALKPDAVFLDVEMPRMNGLELAQKINEIADDTKIIFTTAYKDYALEAFHVQAFDYILKPVTKAAIERVASRLMKQHRPAFPAEPQARQAYIGCFGELEVRNPEGAAVHWPTRKTEELFAYFLCHPETVINKWQLVDLLWPDMEEERAMHNLHNTMYRLKKLLKEQEIRMEIQKVNEGYCLNTGGLSYDVWEYENYLKSQAKTESDASLAERLVSLYSGPLLERKDYLWKTGLAKRYSMLFAKLVRGQVGHHVAKQEWEQAERKADQYLALFPFDEEMNLSLLEIYGSSGQKEKMRKHYAQFERAYREEMGVEPPQEIKNWIEARLA